MRFKCLSSELVNALSIAAHALSARSTMPILEGVLIEAADETIQLTCSDGSMTITTTAPAEVEDEGRVVLPGRLFTDVVRKLPDAQLDASLNDRDVMTLKCLGSRTTIAGMSAAFYPERPKSDADYFLALPQPLVKEMIRQTSFAISTDESRKILTGALIEVGGGEARMVALDGFQLAVRVAKISDEAPAMSAVIPGKFLQELAKIMSDDEDSKTTLMFSRSQLTVSIDKTTMHTSLLEGEYIQSRTILYPEWNTKLIVNREQLALCVERASLMAREGKNNLIKFSVSGGMMAITSNSEKGDVYETLTVIQEGEDIDIAFNSRYVTDVLRAIESGEIAMRFLSSVRPSIITPTAGDEFTYVLLPVRVNG